MHRLLRPLVKARELAERMGAYIILKGHYSALCLPNRQVEFNPTGNSGMATAGSGDVLTGIITALLARGYKTDDACRVGMYLHGLAGDLARRKWARKPHRQRYHPVPAKGFQGLCRIMAPSCFQQPFSWELMTPMACK